MTLIHRARFLATILATCSLVSCSVDKAPVCYAVHGQVSYKGKPLVDAMVVLHRIGGNVEGHQKPIAYTGADGKFVLTTYHTGDGAPVGDYAITVELRAPQTVGEEVVRSGPNVLPAKYARAESSGLKFSVAEGENAIPPIVLN